MPEKKYMQRAISLALKAEGFTNPNPMVGAVIVKDGKIIGEGYHQRCGELHAERNAIKNLTESAEGATIYVTLEPCCHYGKTPPCTEAIIDNKIAKVVIGSRDPNPLVSGKGAAILREHGIEVVEDFMRAECDEINPVFFHYITTKMPYVVMKYAMTCDGKIATKTGDSKWITGEAARTEVQHMRHKYMGIMAGIGTVLADNPMLNVRIEGLKSPVRIICDSRLKIPVDCKLVETAKDYRTIVVCGLKFAENEVEYNVTLSEKIKLLKERGVEVISFPDKNGRVDVTCLMKWLGSQGIDSIFAEGGGTLNDALLRAGLVNRAEVFIAPKMFGGAEAKTPVEGIGIANISHAEQFELKCVKRVDEDVLLTYIKH
ncbi:MAG: bifunctional diaminohydroxyphosphoribosylaminopyrimidine deaminase/5-amino-6-(5-phosphoribosylamino)uracil reductase RibD [Lachnospiraceae bacterium]